MTDRGRAVRIDFSGGQIRMKIEKQEEKRGQNVQVVLSFEIATVIILYKLALFV